MKSFYFLIPGFNLRPTEIQGSVGMIQLSKFPDFLRTRRENASCMITALDNFTRVSLQSETGFSSYFGFGFLAESKNHREQLISAFKEKNIQVRPIVSGNIAIHPLASSMISNQPLPNANMIHEHGFFIVIIT